MKGKKKEFRCPSQYSVSILHDLGCEWRVYHADLVSFPLLVIKYSYKATEEKRKKLLLHNYSLQSIVVGKRQQ